MIDKSLFTALSGSKLDVTKIVSQLMDVERQPITKIDNKIAASSIKISALGQFQTKLEAFKAAVNALQNPANFSAMNAGVLQAGVADVTADATAKAASYQLSVNNLAKKAIWTVSGFTSQADAQAWLDDPSRSALRSNTEATIFNTSTGQYVVSLAANASGAGGDFTVSTPGNGLIATRNQTGEDASFAINGVNFTRSNNVVTDALNGVKIELQGLTSGATLIIMAAPSTARTQLEAVVTTFNDLNAKFRELTQSNVEPSARGALNSDSALGSIMRSIVNGLSKPVTGLTGQSLTTANFAGSGSSTPSLGAIGLTFTQTGDLQIDENLFSAATNLQVQLAKGIRLGFDGQKDLAQRIAESVATDGVLAQRLTAERDFQNRLADQKSKLEEKMIAVEARYTKQYSALDALLSRLGTVSAALKSAIDGLVNSQKSN